MIPTPHAPSTPDEFAEAVRANAQVLPVGARTKPRLSQVDAGTTLLSTRALRGIIEYDPSEFTFTALAGTPLREIAAALAERGQYLPFDPLLAEAGATLGGTVASGLSGPGRFRYGGLRDFILGVRFIDGTGQLLRLGGKVVKNAAGFDLPKFLVGSLGRFGILAELTFKVFPRAASFRTLRIPCESPAEITRTLMDAGRTRWEFDALDASIPGNAVYLRLGAPEAALDALGAEILARFPTATVLTPEEAATYWEGVSEFRWAHPQGPLIKVALTTRRLPELCAALGDARLHISAGGNVAYLSTRSTAPDLHAFSALTLRGEAPLFPGLPPLDLPAVKAALDPAHRFPSFAH